MKNCLDLSLIGGFVGIQITFFTFWGTLLFMIDIRKDSIYIRILYENDSKVDSMTSHIGFWLKKNPLENLIVLPLEFSRLERSG